MDILEVCLVALLGILFVIMVSYYTKGKMRFGKMLFGICSGVALLFPAQYILAYFGYSFALNIFTITVSAVLGIPGVALISALCFV